MQNNRKSYNILLINGQQFLIHKRVDGDNIGKNMKSCEKCGNTLNRDDKFCSKCGFPNKNNNILKVILLFILLSIVIIGYLAYHHNDVVLEKNKTSNSIFYNTNKLNLSINNKNESLIIANTISKEIGLTEKDSFQIEKITEFDNSTYYKLQHYYEEVPVWGETLVMETNSDRKVNSIVSNCTAISDINIVPKLPIEISQNKLLKKLNAEYNIFCQGIYIYCDNTGAPTLVYDFYLLIGDMLYKEVLVDTENGDIVKDIELVDYEQTKVTLLGWEEAYTVPVERDKENYILSTGNITSYIADTKQIEEYPDVWDIRGKSNILLSSSLAKKTDLESIPVNCIDAYGNTIDVINIYTKYCPEIARKKCNIVTQFQYIMTSDTNGEYYIDMRDNAFCFNMDDIYVLGFGFDPKDNKSDAQEFDVVAHELGHEIFNLNVVRKNGTYELEAINEAFADIFATCAENICKKDGNWIIGDNSVRNLGKPDKKQIVNYNRFIYEDNMEHKNSTILSHIAYIIWKNSKDLKDYNLFMELWYRALQYIQSNSTMIDCEKAVYNAARFMIAEGKISHENREIIERAFNKSGVYAELDRTILAYIDVKDDFVNVKEGYYRVEGDNCENPVIINGDISVINDHDGISHLNINLNMEENQIYKKFVWDNLHNIYKEVEKDGGGEYNFSFLKEDGQLFGNLQDIDSQKEMKFALKKYNYLNGINITLAIKNYFETKKDGIQYAFKTKDFQVLYNELYLIPVYEVTNSGLEEIYTVVVTSQSFENAGNAKVCFASDIKAFIDGEKTYLEIEPIEEFNVYDNFNFE